MDLDKEEYEAERKRRRYIDYTEYMREEKPVPFNIYKSIYRDLTIYMDSYNAAVEEAEDLKKIIEEMAADLTTPVNSKDWIIRYYRDRVKDKKGLASQVMDMLE